VVGVLLTSIGYFAPLPDKIEENKDQAEQGSTESSDKNNVSG
jgi:uncharacterized membrane protein